MADFRAKRAQNVLGKPGEAGAKSTALTGINNRRGKRVNSRVAVAVEWTSEGELLRKVGQTRIVGPYGCLLVVRQNLEVRQQIQLTNQVSKKSNPAVVVWRGKERLEGWELGIELIDPQMDFWGLEL